MKKFSVIFWCWAWFVLSNIADVLTSLKRWGNVEMNPFFRDAAHHFVTSHSLVGKGVFTLIGAGVSFFMYRLAAPLDKRVATILASIFPLYYGWILWQVANSNLFFLLHWVTP